MTFLYSSLSLGLSVWRIKEKILFTWNFQGFKISSFSPLKYKGLNNRVLPACCSVPRLKVFFFFFHFLIVSKVETVLTLNNRKISKGKKCRRHCLSSLLQAQWNLKGDCKTDRKTNDLGLFIFLDQSMIKTKYLGILWSPLHFLYNIHNIKMILLNFKYIILDYLNSDGPQPSYLIYVLSHYRSLRAMFELVCKNIELPSFENITFDH